MKPGQDTLSMWTIYDHPKDYPDTYVARRWEVGPTGAMATRVLMTSEDLGWLREQMEDMGLTCLARVDGDDSKIVETWL